MDRKTAVLISMGFEIIGIVIAAIWLGGWLDTQYQLKGMGTVGAIVVGFVGWLTHILMAVKALDTDNADGADEKEKSDDSSGKTGTK